MKPWVLGVDLGARKKKILTGQLREVDWQERELTLASCLGLFKDLLFQQWEVTADHKSHPCLILQLVNVGHFIFKKRETD